MMHNLMDRLHNSLKWLVEANWFRILMSLMIFLNPVAIVPQVFVAFTAPSTEGIALGMWFIFVTIQTAFAFEGVRTKSIPVFLSMSVSALESLTIVVTVLVRRGGF